MNQMTGHGFEYSRTERDGKVEESARSYDIMPDGKKVERDIPADDAKKMFHDFGWTRWFGRHFFYNEPFDMNRKSGLDDFFGFWDYDLESWFQYVNRMINSTFELFERRFRDYFDKPRTKPVEPGVKIPIDEPKLEDKVELPKTGGLEEQLNQDVERAKALIEPHTPDEKAAYKRLLEAKKYANKHIIPRLEKYLGDKIPDHDKSGVADIVQVERDMFNPFLAKYSRGLAYTITLIDPKTGKPVTSLLALNPNTTNGFDDYYISHWFYPHERLHLLYGVNGNIADTEEKIDSTLVDFYRRGMPDQYMANYIRHHSPYIRDKGSLLEQWRQEHDATYGAATACSHKLPPEGMYY